ncbi:hypothetical protein NUW54_g8544 [Trametes sanguinea]|uniref:Uncharacterized protein n=1 Tax=Trametes sanguinea TaxID=158606 RepID=A0ACC1PEZ7_9APHY|nr:hypothetical protein NUW54_g8544 [Trametes sanguinea]
MAELEPKRRGRGHPIKKKKATQNLSHTRGPSGLAPQKPARLQAALDLDCDLNSDSQEEAESGDPEIWDPHSGMKPSPTDDNTGFEEEDEEGIEMELEDISLSERTDSENLRDVLYWGWSKYRYRETDKPKFEDAKRLARECLDACPVEVIRRFFNRSWRFMDAYRKGLTGKAAEWAVRKQKSHRRVGQRAMMSIQAVLN